MKGIIFDLDGTLIDSMYLWQEADEKLLCSYGIQPDEEYNKTIAALTFTQGAQYIKKRYCLEDTVNDIKQKLWDLAFHLYENHIELKKGVRKLLEHLKQKGYAIGMATSCHRKMCEAVLEKNGVRDFFDVILYSEELKQNKTQPFIYIETANQLGVCTEECYVVEDMPFAAQSAKNAGACVIGVYDRYSAKEEQTMKQICHRYIYSFEELLCL